MTNIGRQWCNDNDKSLVYKFLYFLCWRLSRLIYLHRKLLSEEHVFTFTRYPINLTSFKQENINTLERCWWFSKPRTPWYMLTCIHGCMNVFTHTVHMRSDLYKYWHAFVFCFFYKRYFFPTILWKWNV